MFKLTKETINVQEEMDRLYNRGAGAVVTFEGRIRDHNEGQTVVNLTYEAYEKLAHSEGDKIIAEAQESYGVLQIAALHRTGLLEIGEIAVWIGVSCAHRQEAFAACQFVIDQIKQRLPIWKKEVYQDNSYQWVNCKNHNHDKGLVEPVTRQSSEQEKVNSKA